MQELEKQLCDCGCGRQVTKERNKYINGHNRTRKTKENDEGCRKQSEKLKGKTKENCEGRRRQAEKIREYMKNGGASYAASFVTKEGRKRRAEKMKGKIPWNKNLTKDTDERVKKYAETKTGRTKESHEYIKRAAEKMSGRTKENDKGCRKRSEKLVGRTKETHEYIRKSAEKMKGENNPSKRPEVRRKKSKSQKMNWKDPNSSYHTETYHKNLASSRKLKPNKPETFIIRVLKDLSLEKYEYVGNYKVWINDKNPDWLNEGGKKIIEFFGDYWHDKEMTGMSRKEHEKERKNHFKKEGYQVLILGSSDLNSIEKLKKKIIQFDLKKRKNRNDK